MQALDLAVIRVKRNRLFRCLERGIQIAGMLGRFGFAQRSLKLFLALLGRGHNIAQIDQLSIRFIQAQGLLGV